MHSLIDDYVLFQTEWHRCRQPICTHIHRHTHTQMHRHRVMPAITKYPIAIDIIALYTYLCAGSSMCSICSIK